MNFLTLIAVLLVSTSAQAAGFFDIPQDLLPKVIAWVVGIQVICFGIGKGLMKIAKVTETKADDTIAAAFSKFAAMLGTFIAKFGWDVPSEVVEKKAEKLGMKK